MRLILLFLVLFKSAFSNEESDEKYIDLLPEEEKRLFLEKIARRILEDYHNTKKPNVSNVNITEHELDAHSAYVQGLIQEETRHLRKGSNESHRRDTKDDQIKKDKDERKIDVESEKSFKDLTLRNGKREKRTNVSQDPSVHEPEIIPVLPLYDGKPENQKNIPEKIKPTPQNTLPSEKSKSVNKKISSTTPNDSRKLFVYDEVSSDENVEKYNDKPEEQEKLDGSKEQNDDTTSEGKIQDDDEAMKSTVIDNFEPSADDHTEESSKERTDEDDTSDDLSRATRSGGKHYREGDLTRNRNSQEHLDVESSSSVVTLSTIEENTTLNTTSSSDTTTTEETTPPTTSSKGLKLIDINTTISTPILSTKSIKTAQTESQTEITASLNTTSESVRRIFESTISSISNNITLIKNESKETYSDTTVTLTQATKPFLTTSSNKEIKRANSDDSNDFGSTKIPVTKRATLDKEKKADKSIENQTKKSNSMYYVYEVSAEKPPFRSVHDKEEPHYAPVYNYDPQYAYYNPTNRFGPNSDELSSNKDVTREKASNKRRHRFRNPYSVFNDQYKLNVFNILKHQNQYDLLNTQPLSSNTGNYNPNDYIDMDYFFGRNDDPNLRKKRRKPYKKIFPESSDNTHPFNNMQKSLQGHIRAVRKLLYAHKQFGYIPKRPRIPVEDPTLRAKDLTADVFDHNDKYKNDITLDYYFGRQNSHEDVQDSDKLFKFKLSELKDLFTVTPNPIKEQSEETVKDIDNYKGINVDSLIRVLKDMIKLDNEGLVAYDWLGSTVDIQSAFSKLQDMTKRLKNASHIHPNDLELIKYVIYLYKSSKAKNETTLSIGLLKNTINKLRKRIKKKSLIPKIKKKTKKFTSAIKMWKDFRTFLRTLIQHEKVELIKQFESFLAELQYDLTDFHEAVRNVASVTTYKNQNWYSDLKNIYFKNADRSMLLQVILHLNLSRLLGLIEESSRNSLEDSFTDYVKKNRREVDIAKAEFKMLLRLLNEFKELK